MTRRFLSLRSLHLAAVCAITLAGPTRAEVSVGNLGQPTSGLQFVNFAAWQAQSFTTGSTIFDLKRVQLALAGQFDPADLFFVSLYSAAESGAPGLRLATLSPTSPVEGPATYVFDVSAGVRLLLHPNSTYPGFRD